ncbi:UNVERIFIED_CONTAM: hypothetical protein PYX00_008301 [Menopon gallinae]|uniref:Carbonic anhydrase n=1 Tax=Menopon gallinae TaxID=328185 RepID=A0AAW2HNQ0_9NEOP
MLLSEYSFFLFTGLALSKVNCLLRFFWENINHGLSWLADLTVQWLLMGDMLSWLENRVRICEALLLGSVVMIIDYFGLNTATAMCSSDDYGENVGFRFGYRRLNGPAKWKEHYENALGSMQSPINIITCDAVMVKSDPLTWCHHDKIPENMIMHNDGYSVVIQGVWTHKRPQITGEALEDVNYVFNRLYFHWGPTDTEGSEHTINYERYPLELHAIYLKEGHVTPMDAHYEGSRNGMLIIAFLFEIAPVDNPSFLHTVTENLYKIQKPKTRCYIEPFPLTDIFPEFYNSYFKYDGSITQPPCSEIVTYIIQTETIAVSRRQMAMFRKLTAFDGKPMVNNSRPVQKLNDRIVQYCCQ